MSWDWREASSGERLAGPGSFPEDPLSDAGGVGGEGGCGGEGRGGGSCRRVSGDGHVAYRETRSSEALEDHKELLSQSGTGFFPISVSDTGFGLVLS